MARWYTVDIMGNENPSERPNSSQNLIYIYIKKQKNLVVLPENCL